ncbi:DUF134 domain-containing protein [Deferrisoma palaeochoriense]
MSPRPRKPRRCGCAARLGDRVYKPAGVALRNLPRVVLRDDEFEALALCDGQGLTQEEAAARMGVSRGTVQRLVAGARRKVARAILEGQALVIGPAGEAQKGEAR